MVMVGVWFKWGRMTGAKTGNSIPLRGLAAKGPDGHSESCCTGGQVCVVSGTAA